MSLLLLFAWEIWVGAATRRSAHSSCRISRCEWSSNRNKRRQNLEKLVRGLVDLSKADEPAQKLVTKFGIKLNNPAEPKRRPLRKLQPASFFPPARRSPQIPRRFALATKSKNVCAGAPQFCAPAWATAWLTFKAAFIEQAKRSLDLGALFCTETGAPQADDIQASHFVQSSRGDKWRKSLPKPEPPCVIASVRPS